MSEQYRPGDVVNGHFLGHDNQWHPMGTEEIDAQSRPAAGWFPDPQQPGQQRYWDGSGWTHHVASAESVGDTSKLHKKAREALARELVTGEEPLVVIAGVSHQAVIGTDRRAFVYKKGFMAGASFGSEMTSLSYLQLTGVQVHTGMMTGALILQGSGLYGQKTNYWKTGDDDPFKSPNAIPLSRPFDQAQGRAAILRNLIEAAHRPAEVQGASTPMTPSAADELRKLAEMRRDGLINDAEFEEMKGHILSGGS